MMHDAEHVKKENKLIQLLMILLFCMALLQYVNSVQNEFVWDSRVVFSSDPSIREIEYIPQYFIESSTAHFPAHLQLEGALLYYRPLIKIIHLIEYQMFGGNPIGYNIVNIVMNAAVVVLAFLFVHTLVKNVQTAFVAALLFAVNPARAEAVSWAYSDTYLFVAFFSFLTLLLYHQKRYVLSCSVYAFALFCQESAVLLPIILVLYEYCYPQESGPRRYARTVIYLALAGGFLLVRRAVVGSTLLTDVEPLTLANTVAVIIKRYVKIFVFPDAPVTIYQAELFPRLTTEVMLSYGVVLALVSGGVFLWRNKREYLFWYLWFFIYISISYNVGAYNNYLMADKMLYFASFGFCACIALALSNVKGKKSLPIAIIIMLIITQSMMTFNRTRYWKDNITYLEKALEFSPNFVFALVELGNSYLYEKKDFDKAILISKKAALLAPRFNMPYLIQGGAYIGKGDLIQAKNSLENAIQYEPADPRPYYGLGLIFDKTGDYEKALHYYQRSLSLDRDQPLILTRKIQALMEKRSETRK